MISMFKTIKIGQNINNNIKRIKKCEINVQKKKIKQEKQKFS